MTAFFRWILGYFDAEVTGEETGRFFKLCCIQKLVLWNIRAEEHK